MTIESLQIDGYRCFRQFRLEGLRRANLLVGMNNSGKTSILEAIHFLCSVGDPYALRMSMNRRGERLPKKTDRREPEELDVCHLFYGHECDEGSAFRVIAGSQFDEKWVSCAIGEIRQKQEQLFDAVELPEISGNRMALLLDGAPEPRAKLLRLTRDGGLSPKEIDHPVIRRGRNELPPVQFITTELLSTYSLAQHWKSIALTDAEDLIIEALQVLEPDVERIAVIGVDQPLWDYQARGGVLVKLRGMRSPVPLGSMGEGMWRMLIMATAVVHSAGGVLLVDEIDTGLHHTVMADMWKLVVATAERLDVQVFATTHSLDCVRSLATSIRQGMIPARSASIQRVEKERGTAVPYSDTEIVIAAERGIEVR